MQIKPSENDIVIIFGSILSTQRASPGAFALVTSSFDFLWQIFGRTATPTHDASMFDKDLAGVVVFDGKRDHATAPSPPCLPITRCPSC